MRGLPPRRRAPWWAYLLAASCLITFAFDIYVNYMGYGPEGAAISDADFGGYFSTMTETAAQRITGVTTTLIHLMRRC